MDIVKTKVNFLRTMYYSAFSNENFAKKFHYIKIDNRGELEDNTCRVKTPRIINSPYYSSYWYNYKSTSII